MERMESRSVWMNASGRSRRLDTKRRDTKKRDRYKGKPTGKGKVYGPSRSNGC
jgi:hypothetical protein